MTGFVPDAANSRAFRDALGKFATGVTVVTAEGPLGPLGMTANSFSSVSLDPPLVLWSVARTSARFAAFEQAQHFAIHILGADQETECHRFSRGGGAFAQSAPGRNAWGVPVLAHAIARFDCELHARHDGGDHLILVGRVLECRTAEGAPLVFSAGRIGGFAPAVGPEDKISTAATTAGGRKAMPPGGGC